MSNDTAQNGYHVHEHTHGDTAHTHAHVEHVHQHVEHSHTHDHGAETHDHAHTHEVGLEDVHEDS
jgi:hypothetical protein